MPTYRYRAIAADGKSVTGALQADSEAAVLRLLDEQSLFPVSVEEGGGASESVISGRKRKVRLRSQTAFYSQMADLLSAGVPLLRSLDVLQRQKTNAVLSEVLNDVKEDVSAGETLADAMAKHPNAFNPLHVTMIRAGESGGFLEDVLMRIAVFAERQDELRNKLIGSTIYPVILVTVGSAIVIALMVLVVPQIRRYLKPESLNPLSHAVFGITDVITQWYLVIAVALAALIAGLVAYRTTEHGRLTLARAQLKAPVVGPIFTMVAICRFCRILGTLLHNGVPILQSLDIAKESAGNPVLANHIAAAAEHVQKGESLSSKLADSGYFPADILDMMAVAEESNNLDNVLVKIAENNENRTARQIDLAVRFIEPVLLLVIAILILCIALALLLPILTMASTSQV